MAYQLGGGGAKSSPAPAAPTTYPTLAQLRPTAAPAPAPPSLAESLGTTASNLARGTVADQVAAIQAQQAADRAAAAAQAKQIAAASQAAAGFLGPGGYNLGGLASQDYARAIAQTGGLASGYTGQLRDDLAGQTQAADNTLRAIPGNEQTLVNRGGDLANALYGLRGSLPGQGLAAEGLAATTTARLLPAQLLATGQNEALGVIGAGRAQAAQLDPQIAAARGDLSKLTQGYLTDLVKQQIALAPQVSGSVSGGLYSVDPLTGQPTILSQPRSSTAPYRVSPGQTIIDPVTGKVLYQAPAAPASSTPYRYQDGSGVEWQINPDGTAVKLPGAATPPSASSSRVQTYRDGAGNVYAINPDGSINRLPGATKAPSAKGGGLSASSFNVALRDTKSQITAGAKPTTAGSGHYDTAGTFTPPPITAPPVSVATALSNGYAAIPAGVKPQVWKTRIDGLVKAAYAPYIPQISTAAKAAVALGRDDANTTIEKIAATNAYPVDLVQRVVALIYRQANARVRSVAPKVGVNIFGR